MIGVDIRGSHLGGLLRYLYGPGRANEHENPHIVASWTGQTERLDPKLVAGRVDFRPLTSKMMAPNDLMRTPQKQPVMHIPLSAAKEGPGGAADRLLSDREWSDIARRVVKDLGLGGVNDPAGCRWIAVRHGPEHVHIVVTLARQNGQRADVPWSKLRISKSCEEISRAYGLRVAPTPDSTAGRWPTRAEVEKFKRQHEGRLADAGVRSGVDPARAAGDVAEQLGVLASPAHPAHPRNQLKELVQRTAARSSTTEAFIANLQEQARRSAGKKDELVVRTYTSRGGEIRGYAVGFKHWSAVGDDGLVAPVMYGGSKLDASLSLPRLQAERGWSGLAPDQPATPQVAISAAGSTAAGSGAEPPSASRLPSTGLKLNLRQLAEQAASEAGTVDEYFAALQRRGVVVQPRYSVQDPSHITGYKVGLRAHRNRAGDDLEWMTGSRLDPNGTYTLTRLQSRWAASGSGIGGTRDHRGMPVAQDEALASTRETVQVVRAATTVARKRLETGQLDATDDVARSVADVLHGAAAAWEADRAGPLTGAARAYDRAFRIPQHRHVPRRGPGADLTLAALGLTLATSAKSPSAVERIALMASLKMLIEVVAAIRIAQLRNEAAAAARAAAAQLEKGIRDVLPATMPAAHRQAVYSEARAFATAAEPPGGRMGSVDSGTSLQRPQGPARGR